MPRARPWFIFLAWAGMIISNTGTVLQHQSGKPYAEAATAVLMVTFNICLWHIIHWAAWGWQRRSDLDRITIEMNGLHREAAEAVVGLRATARSVHKRLGLDQ